MRRSGHKPEELWHPAIWFVLTLVMEQPSHGYDISQRYERRFGSIMRVSVPRVYHALERLHDAGMIEPAEIKVAEPVTRQHAMRRSYRVTPRGVEAYRGWISGELGDDRERPRLLGPIAAGGLLGDDVLLDAIDRFEEKCRKELRRLDRGRAMRVAARPEELAEQLITDQRRRELEARCDWAEDAREILLEREQERTGSAGPPAVRTQQRR